MNNSITKKTAQTLPMPAKTKWNVLSNIKTICDSIVESGLSPKRTTLYQTTILRLQEYFNTNENQTWILCFAVYQHFRDNNQIFPSEYADFLSVNVLKVAAMYSDFVTLRQKGLLDFTDSKSTFSVTKELIKRILNNETINHNMRKETSYLDFVAKVANLYENNKYTDNTVDDLVCQLCDYEESNETIPFVIRSKELINDSKTRFMFYDICNDSLSGMPSCLCTTIDDIYEDSERFRIARQFFDEKHILMVNGLVEFTEKGLPCGIAVLLHGTPGCGKTETVYQLAKKTGRSIMQVDISATKSAWFGESEKKIKEVFTDYKELCKKMKKLKCGRTPILLFNECDAVFSKRKDISYSNTAQTENSIQNIILEEMENLEGILIATTNLTDNLNPAFERRFLFKIQFENPSVEAKKAIWKNKLPWLTTEKAQHLAKTYNFSGDEIDNIVRKAEMKEIISGKRPAWSDIVDMCKVEKLDAAAGATKRMGFAV